MDLYKIGEIYLYSDNKYIDSYYPKVDNPFKNNDEYLKQLQPFYYSDKFKMYKPDTVDESYYKTEYRVHIIQENIYNDILEKMGLKQNLIKLENNKKKYEKYTIKIYKDECGYDILNNYDEFKTKLMLKICNASYLPDYIFDDNLSNVYKHHFIKYYMEHKNVDVRFDAYKNIKSIDYKVDIWNNLKDIYLDSNFQLNLELTHSLTQIHDEIDKYYKFLKIFELKGFDGLTNLSNIELAAVLIDKLNLHLRFKEYYFDESQRLSQIQEVQQYHENILKNVYEPIKINDENLYISNSNFNYMYKLNNARELSITFENIRYIYAPNDEINENLKHCLSRHIYVNVKNHFQYSPNLNNYSNKYLCDNIVKSSNYFTNELSEYSKDEIYELDIRDLLNDYEKFNNAFKEENVKNTIHNLIEAAIIDYIDDEIRNIFYNMYYLKMFELLGFIEFVSLKHIRQTIFETDNTNM